MAQYAHNLYFESSAMILTLITLGSSFFETRAKADFRRHKELMDLAPQDALGGTWRDTGRDSRGTGRSGRHRRD